MERSKSLESCVEMSPSQLQLSHECVKRRAGHAKSVASTPDKPQWRVYRMNVDIAQAAPPAKQDSSASTPDRSESFAAQPQPLRPYRCSVPARPSSARPASANPTCARPSAVARPSSARLPSARPCFALASGAARAADMEPGVGASEAHATTTPRAGARRPWSAHARLMYTSDEPSRVPAHALVTREGRALQQAAAGLPDKAEMRRPTSARSRSRCQTGESGGSELLRGSVVGRSAWSVAAAFDAPLCIAPVKAHRPVSASRVRVGRQRVPQW